MIVDETIQNIKRALEHFRVGDPQLDAYLNGGAPSQELGEAVVAAIENAPSDGQVALLASTPWSPPVIGSPLWFLEEVAEHYGQARTDYLVDELCGLKVLQREGLSEPVMIMANGQFYTVVPDWARKTAFQLQAEETERRARVIAKLPEGITVDQALAGVVANGTDAAPAAA